MLNPMFNLMSPEKLDNLKMTAFVRFYGIVLNPLVAIVSPTIIEMDDRRTVLKVPLNFMTRNHLKVMYFGALNIGAELSIAVLAFKKTRESEKKIDFIFKDFKAQYLKRAQGDVHFICEDNETVLEQMAEAEVSTERINRTIKAYAVVPSQDPNDRVAEFELTLSVRQRQAKT
jgi:hypothetical protein